MTERVTELQHVYDFINAVCEHDPKFQEWGASALRYLNQLDARHSLGWMPNMPDLRPKRTGEA